MRKFLLILLIASSVIYLNSCSSDTSSAGNKIFFKLNGVDKNFSNGPTNDVNGLVSISGFIMYYDDPATEGISFQIQEGEEGTDVIQNLTYTHGPLTYVKTDTNILNSNVTSNISKRTIKGTFSGTLTSSEGYIITISNGSFSISY